MSKRASSFFRFPYFSCSFPVWAAQTIELEREAGRRVLGSSSLPLEKSERVHTEKERTDAVHPFRFVVTTFCHNIEVLEKT